MYMLSISLLLHVNLNLTGMTSSSIWEEKCYNPRLTKTLDEFVEIMNNLNLPYPRQIDTALPLNYACGIQGP